MKKNWIQGVVSGMRKGALRRKAKATGQTVAEYSQSTKGKSTRTKRQINLARTLKGFHKKK
jgi:hypothetical protein